MGAVVPTETKVVGQVSRTTKDRPYRLGGQRRKYYISEKHHAQFTRDCRRRARAQASQAIRTGKEPEPRYPVEKEYYD